MSYLQQYVAALDLVILAEQRVIIVNTNSEFLYLSPAIRSQYGLCGEYLNASYIDLPPIKQIAPSCIREDLECLQTRATQQYITSQNHNGEIQLYLKQKTPLIDCDLAVGVRVDFLPIFSLGHFKPYINQHIINYNKQIEARSTRHKIILTELEELILFLLIMYVKPKVVTLHLNTIMHKDVAISTIRNTIHQQLLRKFAVFTIEELIDKAIFLGYDTILPRIMVEQFSVRIA